MSFRAADTRNTPGYSALGHCGAARESRDRPRSFQISSIEVLIARAAKG